MKTFENLCTLFCVVFALLSLLAQIVDNNAILFASLVFLAPVVVFVCAKLFTLSGIKTNNK